MRQQELPTLQHLVQTPTLTFTGVGMAALILHMCGFKHADAVAATLLGAAGMGVAIALHSEVVRQEKTWGWGGLLAALRRPSKFFLVGLFGHLPQLLLALIIITRRASNRKE